MYFFAPSSNQFAHKSLDLGAKLLVRKKFNFEAWFAVYSVVPVTVHLVCNGGAVMLGVASSTYGSSS